MATKPILYSYFRSSASWRVRIALAYKGIEYDYKAIHLIQDGGVQHTEEYKSVNPMGQVPTLVIDGLTLTQSLPIIEYLEETRPENPLLPKGAAERAAVRALAEVINSGIQPLQNLSVLQHFDKVAGEGKKMEWGRYWIDRGFQGLEALAAQSAGRFLVGDDVTLADCVLKPQMSHVKSFKVDMTQFPTIARVNAELEKHPAFQKADAFTQPDCPDDLKKKQ